jgi:hypothetical protein
MKCRVKNTFLHFEDSVGSYLDCSSVRSRARSCSPTPCRAVPRAEVCKDDVPFCEDGDDDAVSMPDTDDGVSPTAAERYRKFFNEFDDEYSEENPTPPLSPLPQMPALLPQVTSAYAFPQQVAQPVMMPQGMVAPTYWVWQQPEMPAAAPAKADEPQVQSQDAGSRSCAGTRRTEAWKSMSAGLEKPEVPKPAPSPADVQGQLVQFVYDVMVQKGFDSPRGHLLLDVYLEVWREIVGTANASGGRTALDRFAGLLSSAPELFEVTDVNVVPCALRTRSCYGVDNREKMVRLVPCAQE